LQIVEENILRSGPISNLMDTHATLEEIAPLIMAGTGYEVIDDLDLKFSCKCNRDRLLDVLKGLSADERKDIQHDDTIEVVCNFCGQRYLYDPEELDTEIN